jgi:signal transduction histidine kinase
MKLIRKTIYQIALALVPVMLLSTIFINYTIRWIAFHEADKFLAYEMERMQRNFDRTGEILPVFGMSEILSGEPHQKPTYRDTTFISEIDGEDERYRELRFSLPDGDSGRYSTVILRQVTLSKDDIARGSVYIILMLVLLMSGTILLVVNMQTERIWAPFFRTLERLQAYRVQQAAPEFEPSRIHEFDLLNHTVSGMLRKMSGDYRRVKELNENTAHEIQTHLAVIKASNEELLNILPVDSDAIEQAKRSHLAATRLSHIQKSLTLLSKIGNKEFESVTEVHPDEIIVQILEEFQELLQLRDIQVRVDLKRCPVRMDYGLAVVLFSNLIKNAVKHNLDGGELEVTYGTAILIVRNSGKSYPGDPSELMKRFIRGDGGNTGLGLAIARQICETYGFEINYEVSGTWHQISIRFR